MTKYLLIVFIFTVSCNTVSNSAQYDDSADVPDDDNSFSLDEKTEKDDIDIDVYNIADIDETDEDSDLNEDVSEEDPKEDSEENFDTEADDDFQCPPVSSELCAVKEKCEKERIYICSITYDSDGCPSGEIFNIGTDCGYAGKVCNIVDEKPTCECDEGFWTIDGKCFKKTVCPDYITTDETIKPKDTIASFNVLHLGWDNSKDMEALACIIDHFDVVALIELETLAGITDLATYLKRLSGEDWDFHISENEVGEGTYKEFYGFVWRKSKVVMTGVTGFFPETDDEFKREPYAANFTIGNFSFTIAAIHVIFGDTIAQRRAEAEHLTDVYNYLQDLDVIENNIIIAGDFNLPVSDSAFTILSLDSVTNAISPDQKTTIGDTGLVSAYDNILLSPSISDFAVSSGVLDFTKDNYATIRFTVSDHIPVWVEIE